MTGLIHQMMDAPEDERMEDGNGLITRAAVSTPIVDFFQGANVFITGGTGFLGKVLIEKLLRACPDIECLYLLMRAKKGQDVATRLDAIFDDPLFYRVLKLAPKFRHKIRTVTGDCSLPGMGLTAMDRKLLIENVNIVFHVAATVRFDEKLRAAVAINVTATKDVVQMCKEMPKLKAAVHVSTAYCNCHLPEIDEKFYEPTMPYEKLSALVDACSDNMLDKITPIVLDQLPNTYALTKAAAENIVKRESGDLPIVVFRPAIVVATCEEPVPGWIDNLYGPTGVVYGAGTGVLKTLHCDADCLADVVPADMVINSMIASAWDVGTNRVCGKEVPVYNYVSSCENPLKWRDFMTLLEKYGLVVPCTSAIWYYCLTLNKFFWINWLYTVFLHFLPAFFVDTVLICQGKTPRLWKIYKKIDKFSKIISYFCTNTWTFHNNNVQLLWKSLSPDDQKLFMFSMKELDWNSFFYSYIRGCRVFLAKDDLSTIPAAMVKWMRLYWLHQAVKAVCSIIFLRIAWSVVIFTWSLFST